MWQFLFRDRVLLPVHSGRVWKSNLILMHYRWKYMVLSVHNTSHNNKFPASMATTYGMRGVSELFVGSHKWVWPVSLGRGLVTCWVHLRDFTILHVLEVTWNPAERNRSHECVVESTLLVRTPPKDQHFIGLKTYMRTQCTELWTCIKLAWCCCAEKSTLKCIGNRTVAMEGARVHTSWLLVVGRRHCLFWFRFSATVHLHHRKLSNGDGQARQVRNLKMVKLWVKELKYSDFGNTKTKHHAKF